MEILYFLVVSIIFNLIVFIPAFIFKTDKLTDISYSLTFIFLTFWALSQNDTNLYKFILAFLILIWALRLGTYLFIRINKTGRDKRFDGLREDFLKFLGFWLLQGVSVWVVMISSLLFFAFGTEPNIWLFIIGVITFLKGLIIETIADWQKYKFINNPENKGKWIQSGLWKYSRHPNYLGEIMVWIGIYLLTFSGLENWPMIWALISPVYIFSLIRFVSGIPILEKKAEEKWGSNPDYQNYKKETGILLPCLKRK